MLNFLGIQEENSTGEFPGLPKSVLPPNPFLRKITEEGSSRPEKGGWPGLAEHLTSDNESSGHLEHLRI